MSKILLVIEQKNGNTIVEKIKRKKNSLLRSEIVSVLQKLGISKQVTNITAYKYKRGNKLNVEELKFSLFKKEAIDSYLVRVKRCKESEP